MKRRPVVVVLAAGRGERFRGSGHKLEQALGPETVLAATLGHAIESQLQVLVVTTERLAVHVRRMVAARDVVIVPEAGANEAAGMGHSIAAGVAASSQASAWLVLPGDMPLVRPSSLLAVADALDHSPIAYAQYRGRRGHPVGFGAELYSELAALSGDDGARRIVARFPGVGVELDDPGVLMDVDTTDDLARLREARSPA
jgi:molybdenum cofactor cytidylyltransferase